MFWQLKKEKIKLSVPTLSMQYVVVLLFKLPVGNNKHPNFEWRGGRGGGVWTVLFSEVTPFEDKVSTILSLIVHQQAKQYLNNLKCNNCMMLSYCVSLNSNFQKSLQNVEVYATTKEINVVAPVTLSERRNCDRRPFFQWLVAVQWMHVSVTTNGA